MKTIDDRAVRQFRSDLRNGFKKRVKLATPDAKNPVDKQGRPHEAAPFAGYLNNESPSPHKANPGGHVENDAGFENQSVLLQPRFLGLLLASFAAAAVIGAATGFYFVSISPPSLPSKERASIFKNDVSADRQPTMSETMAMRIEAMRKIASEEPEGRTDTATTMRATGQSIPPSVQPVTRKAEMTLQSETGRGEARHCSAASLALALCDAKAN